MNEENEDNAESVMSSFESRVTKRIFFAYMIPLPHQIRRKRSFEVQNMQNMRSTRNFKIVRTWNSADPLAGIIYVFVSCKNI